MANGSQNTSSKRRLLTDAELKAMLPGSTATESLPGRGTGSIYFERRASGAIEAYYRRRTAGKAPKTKLGIFQATPRSSGLTLAEIRTKARELAAIAVQHGDLKAYTADQEAKANLERIERQRQADEAERLQRIESARGSFAELFQDYIDSRRSKVGGSQIAEFERVLRVELLGNYPALMAMKARDIRPDDIRTILIPIWDRGSKGMADKVRAYLHAAFKYGLKAEHSLERSSRKSFALEQNPVAMLPKEYEPTACERALTDTELLRFWSTIENTEGIGPIMARLFRFAIATGGQRIEQIVREPWESYDLKARTVCLIDKKGRGSTPRKHLVPLTDRAIEILSEVRELTRHLKTDGEECKWPWTTTGQKPITISSPGHAVADWLKSSHAVIDGNPIPLFTPRDLRRTCTQFMQRHGIEDHLSDLLQSHGLTGVVVQHYRNNPQAYLPEKWRAIEAFERALSSLLDNNQEVPFSTTEEAPT